MNELKPVVIFKGVRHNSRTEIWGFLSSPDVVPQANTDLYAIPDTHRVVSVELLTTIEKAFVDYEMAVGDAPPYPHLKMMKELRAIIDNKKQS